MYKKTQKIELVNFLNYGCPSFYPAYLNAIKSILNKVDYENRNMNLDYTVDQNIYYSWALEIELMENHLREIGKFIV